MAYSTQFRTWIGTKRWRYRVVFTLHYLKVRNSINHTCACCHPSSVDTASRSLALAWHLLQLQTVHSTSYQLTPEYHLQTWTCTSHLPSSLPHSIRTIDYRSKHYYLLEAMLFTLYFSVCFFLPVQIFFPPNLDYQTSALFGTCTLVQRT